MHTNRDVLTLGETMVMMNPHESGPLRHIMDFRKRIGGAESNVATGIARLGHSASWISRLGDDPLGRYVRDTIRGAGVDTQYVQFDADAPTGLMFKERRELRESSVYYYRDGSAASRMGPEIVPEDALAETEYLHLSGITPALSDSCATLIDDVIDRANDHDVTISFDPNLRFKLWEPAQMRRTLLPMIERCDIVLPGIEEATTLIEMTEPAAIAEKFLAMGPTEVVVKCGEDGAYVGTESLGKHLDGYTVERVVDPVGAGDGFAAGYLSGRIDGLDPVTATDRANAVGALATTVTGDVEGLPTRTELRQFTDGETVEYR
ncbi:sugar kinase [Halocatena halophila]|uniref:sugar kinase n=1 Tax=Halocatena halophila TaxID=2814576 RepID=UPI002ED1F322